MLLAKLIGSFERFLDQVMQLFGQHNLIELYPGCRKNG